MADELQQQRIIAGDYRVIATDHGQVLYLAGGIITLMFGLPEGFYVTIVNYKGQTLTFLTPGANLRSPNGSTTLTQQWASTTLLRIPGSMDFLALGIP